MFPGSVGVCDEDDILTYGASNLTEGGRGSLRLKEGVLTEE